MRGRFVALRAWRVNSSGRRRSGWLIGEDASDGKRRYYWSNFGPETALERLVEYTHRRHWVERYHEEAKELLGWDQYQGRLWPGFHRHAVSVMLAYSFLVWQEWHQRQRQTRPGRPRRAFSPSARSASAAAAGGASADQRLAPPRSGQGVAVA
jgi:SRSO17 transposase